MWIITPGKCGSVFLNRKQRNNMKRYIFRSLYSFTLIFALASCEKNVISYGDSTLADPTKTLLKLNYSSLYAANPAVQIAFNGSRVTPLIAGRTPYPGGGYNTIGDSRPDYLLVNPGEISIKISIPQRGTNLDSVVLYNTSITVEAGKNYTAHITDTAAKTQTVLLTDDFARPDSNFAKYKFVNLMPNVPAVDLYYGTTLVASNIAYKAASNYFTLQIPSSTLSWAVRPAGAAATTTALALYSSASTTTNQRVYTVFAIGYAGATDAVRKPYVSFLLNR
jgi:hypothetical protein